MTITKNRWFLPLAAVAIGVACLVALWAGGNLDDGLRALAVMAAVAVLFALGGRSETIRGLRGDGRDERFRHIDVTATAFAGMVAIGSILAMCLWEWAHGRGGEPYTQLATIAGIAYVVALGALRWRS